MVSLWVIEFPFAHALEKLLCIKPSYKLVILSRYLVSQKDF